MLKLALSALVLAFAIIGGSSAYAQAGGNPNNAVGVWGTDTGTGLPCIIAPPGGSSTCKLPVAPQTAAPLGCAQLTSLATSTALTVPAGATVAAIIPESQSVRWRDDGTDPTATVGMLLLPSQPLSYGGVLATIRFIQTTASAKLNVCFY